MERSLNTTIFNHIPSTWNIVNRNKKLPVAPSYPASWFFLQRGFKSYNPCADLPPTRVLLQFKDTSPLDPVRQDGEYFDGCAGCQPDRFACCIIGTSDALRNISSPGVRGINNLLPINPIVSHLYLPMCMVFCPTHRIFIHEYTKPFSSQTTIGQCSLCRSFPKLWGFS